MSATLVIFLVIPKLDVRLLFFKNKAYSAHYSNSKNITINLTTIIMKISFIKVSMEKQKNFNTFLAYIGMKEKDNEWEFECFHKYYNENFKKCRLCA